MSCANIDNLSVSDIWDLPPPTFFPLLGLDFNFFKKNIYFCFNYLNYYFLASTHVALDWVSRNWYYVDDDRDMIYMCTYNMKYCEILIDVNLNKPRSIALDPTKGYVFLLILLIFMLLLVLKLYSLLMVQNSLIMYNINSV